ncbi:MAG: CNNM domain-containing protein [Phycisphaeraceae bacterium]|nr:CNNM domain-containing protein [Phycisphaeraceae bacterium]
MSGLELLFWYGAAAAGMAGSALFSGLETGIYTLNRVRLHVRAHTAGSRAAVLLRMTARPNRLLGTLLVGNNLANYLASYAVAILLSRAGHEGWAQVAINALILTPLLFIFGEVLPKDMFRRYADRLVYPMARPLAWMQILLHPFLLLIGAISGLLRRVFNQESAGMAAHPRRVVTELLKEGVGHGLISAYQSDMIDRVLRAGRLNVRHVMVPWKKVTTVSTSQPPEAVWSLADRVPYARLPMLDSQSRCIGFLEVVELLKQPLESCPPLEQLARPIVRIEPETSLHDAMLHLQVQRVSMALVTSDGQPIGMVTIKDLVEPIVGKLEAW